MDDEEPVVLITHGDQVQFKKSVYQAHATPVTTPEHINAALEHLRGRKASSRSAYAAMPFAYRVQNFAGGESSLVEGHEDDGELGAGEKLLHLLVRWDIRNVLLIVTRRDTSGPSGRLGVQRYKVLLDRAKSVLEQCYVESMQPQQPEQLYADEEQDKSLSSYEQEMGDGGTQSGAPMLQPVARIPLPMNTLTLAGYTVPWPKGFVPTANGSSKGMKWGQVSRFDAADPAWERPQAATDLNTPWTAQEVEAIVQKQKQPKQKSVAPSGRGAYGAGGGGGGGGGGYSHSMQSESMDIFGGGGMDGAEGDRLSTPVDVLSLYGTLQPPMLQQSTITELRSLRKPPPTVHAVFRCVACLLNYPDDSWAGCREMVAHSSFRAQMLMLDTASLSWQMLRPVRRYLQEPDFEPELVRRQSPVAAELLGWVIQVVQLFDLVRESQGMSSANSGGGGLDMGGGAMQMQMGPTVSLVDF
jgi:hypothetical protein